MMRTGKMYKIEGYKRDMVNMSKRIKGGGPGRMAERGWLIALAALAAFALTFAAPVRAEAVSSYKGTFAKLTSTGTQTVTGVGFQPKAVIFFWTKNTSFGTSAANGVMGVGFAGGSPLANGAVVMSGQDNVGTTNYGWIESSTYSIVTLNPTTPALAARASVTSFDADGFTLNWQTADAVADQIHFIAIGGADITGVKVGQFNGPATVPPNLFSVTGVGFQPDAVMFAFPDRTSTTMDAVQAAGALNIGIMTATGQVSLGLGGRDGQTATTHAHVMHDAQAISGIRRNAIDQVASYVSMDPDGFSLNFTSVGGSAPYVYLAIKGGLHKLGSFTKRTSAGSQPVTGVGFEPNTLMLFSHDSTATNGTVQTADPAATMSIGAATSSTARGTVWMHDRSIINTDINMISHNNLALRMGASNNGITDYGQADFSSFDADGFTLNWITSDATARRVLYWAIGTSCTDSDLATLTTTNPASSSTVSGTVTIQTQVGTETAPDTMTGMVVNIAGAGACNVTNGAMTWNAGTGRWEYSWNTSACGTGTPVTGVTVDVTGTDPDCSTTVNAAQVTNVTIDNSCTDPDPTTAFSIVLPVTGQKVKNTYNVRAQVTGESTPGAGSATVTIAGTSACDVTGAAMSWDAGTGRWVYAWNTSACGTVTPETGIIINAAYTDPDCGDVANASQVSDITVDNTPATYTVTTCADCHGNPPIDAPSQRNTPEGAVVGSHYVHSTAAGIACTACHIDNGTPASVYPQGLGHREGMIDMATPLSSGSYSKGASFAQVNNPVLGRCNNTYCHSDGTSVSTGSIAANNSPTWGQSGTGCTMCHGSPPGYDNNSPKKNSHSAHTTDCSVCHDATTSDGGSSITNPANHANGTYNVVANASASFTYTYNSGGGSCASNSCHINAQWGVTQLDCVSCHSTAQDAGDGAPTRRAITAEFNSTWSHKRSAGGTVTKWDCIVCHLEGDPSTGRSTALHKNNLIDLRNPDTGDGTGLTAFTSFSRNTGSATLESWVTNVQNNMCLKCHDADGAASTQARVPTTGTAKRPFGEVVMNSYNQEVLDVDGQFNTANATFHPVKGPQNNPFCTVNTMVAPWNTKTAPEAHPNQTPKNGPQISCWDCHAALTTAHGGTATLRAGTSLDYNANVGAVTAVGDTLCLTCHLSTIYTGSGTSSQTAFGGVNAGTVEGTLGDTAASHLTRMTNANTGACTACHGSSWLNPGRPFRAEDVHGYNRNAFYRPALGLTWTPTTSGWTSPGNVASSDNAYATYSGTAQQNLSITNFGYRVSDVPDGVTITGIAVIIEGNGASATAAQRQIRVNLSKTAGTPAGTWKTGIQLPQTTDTTVVFGGPEDLWGTTWTPADIRAAGFGMLISDNDTTAATLSIDYVRIVVFTNRWGNAQSTLGSSGVTGAKGYAFLRNATDKSTTVNVRWQAWRPRKDNNTALVNDAWGCSWELANGGGNPCNHNNHGTMATRWISYGPGGVY